MMIKIKNGKIITAQEILTGYNLYIKDGVIAEITPEDLSINEAREIDAGGNYVSPGFVDTHTHGAGGADFLDATPEAYITAAKMSACHGATTVLPTMTSVDCDRIIKTVCAFEEAKKTPDIADLAGLHLEGPFFAKSQKGAQEDRFIHPFDIEETKSIISATDKILRWTAAPELPGVDEFANIVTKHGILPCVGHTDATFDETIHAYDIGFSHATHLYSCMSTIHRVNAYRIAGALEAAYFLDGMTVELIADGCHLPASLLKYAYKFKGRDKIALVTDSMRAAGMPEGPSVLGSLENGMDVIVEDGVAKLLDRTAFAGSVATCDRLVRNMINLAEVSLVDSVYMMATTPARIVGLSDRGELKKGKRADIVIFNENIEVKYTICGGRVIFKG